MRKKSITANLSETTIRMLADISRETERSISSLVREAVKSWLKEQKKDDTNS